jgi:hypothetical protein
MRRSDCIGNILWHMNLSPRQTGSRQRRIIPQRRFRISISITPIRHHPFGAGYRFAKDPTPFPSTGPMAGRSKAKHLWRASILYGPPSGKVLAMRKVVPTLKEAHRRGPCRFLEPTHTLMRAVLIGLRFRVYTGQSDRSDASATSSGLSFSMELPPVVEDWNAG